MHYSKNMLHDIKKNIAINLPFMAKLDPRGTFLMFAVIKDLISHVEGCFC